MKVYRNIHKSKEEKKIPNPKHLYPTHAGWKLLNLYQSDYRKGAQNLERWETLLKVKNLDICNT